MGSVKNNKPRIVVSIQHFDGGTPTTILESYQCAAGMDFRKAVEFAIARIVEEKLKPKQTEKHLHD
jgi:hypothetical protein